MSDIRAPKINRVMLSGRIANDLELKYTGAGKAFVKFTIAVDDNYKDANGTWQDRAHFVSCVAWEKTAETFVNNAHKGSPVIVEGKLTVNQYTDKDGNKKTSTDVVCSYIQTLEYEKKSGDAPTPQSNSTNDDVPF